MKNIIIENLHIHLHNEPSIGAALVKACMEPDEPQEQEAEEAESSVTQYIERRILNELPDGTDADYDEGPEFDEWRFEREAA